jgi:hypothetical protein
MPLIRRRDRIAVRDGGRKLFRFGERHRAQVSGVTFIRSTRERSIGQRCARFFVLLPLQKRFGILDGTGERRGDEGENRKENELGFHRIKDDRTAAG